MEGLFRGYTNISIIVTEMEHLRIVDVAMKDYETMAGAKINSKRSVAL